MRRARAPVALRPGGPAARPRAQGRHRAPTAGWRPRSRRRSSRSPSACSRSTRSRSSRSRSSRSSCSALAGVVTRSAAQAALSRRRPPRRRPPARGRPRDHVSSPRAREARPRAAAEQRRIGGQRAQVRRSARPGRRAACTNASTPSVATGAGAVGDDEHAAAGARLVGHQRAALLDRREHAARRTRASAPPGRRTWPCSSHARVGEQRREHRAVVGSIAPAMTNRPPLGRAGRPSRPAARGAAPCAARRGRRSRR